MENSEENPGEENERACSGCLIKATQSVSQPASSGPGDLFAHLVEMERHINQPVEHQQEDEPQKHVEHDRVGDDELRFPLLQGKAKIIVIISGFVARYKGRNVEIGSINGLRTLNNRLTGKSELFRGIELRSLGEKQDHQWGLAGASVTR